MVGAHPGPRPRLGGTTRDRARQLRELQSGTHLVVLDLRELEFIDSAGVHAIVNASIRARKAGQRLVLVHGSPTVNRTFALAGISDEVEIGDVEPQEARRADSLLRPFAVPVRPCLPTLLRTAFAPLVRGHPANVARRPDRPLGVVPDAFAETQIGPPGWSAGARRALSNKPRERRNPTNSGASLTSG
jgi:anti-anti-sigma factor